MKLIGESIHIEDDDGSCMAGIVVSSSLNHNFYLKARVFTDGSPDLLLFLNRNGEKDQTKRAWHLRSECTK